MKALAWTLLTLVFADEVLALAATAAWGLHAGGVPLAIVAPAAWAGTWFLFAAPRARFGGRVATPVVKVGAFGVACLALWAAGHPGLAAALAVFSALINGAAQLPPVREVQGAQARSR